MSKKDQHIDFLNFRRYYNGEMSGNEKSQFEENIENDPFAKEAFEGFQIFQTDFDKIAAIEKLNIRFKENLGLEEKTTVNLKPFFALAAMVLLFFGMFYVLKNINFSSNHSEIADNTIPTSNQANEKQDLDEEVYIVDIDESTPIEEEVPLEETNANTTKKSSLGIEKVEESYNPSKLYYTDDDDILISENTVNKDLNKKQITTEDFYRQNKNQQSNSIEDPLNQSTIASKEQLPNQSKANLIEAQADIGRQEVVKKENDLTEKNQNSSSYKVGLVAYKQGNYNKALQNFTESIKANQNVSSSNFYIGMSYFNLNKHNKAIGSFDKVINSTSFFKDDATWYKAISYLNKGQKSKAKPLLQSLIDKNSSFKTVAENKLKTHFK